MDFTNKIEFKQISKECKDTFLTLLKENNIEVIKKQITPIYKTAFQGKIYFSTFQELIQARKLLSKAKEIEHNNFLKWLENERNNKTAQG